MMFRSLMMCAGMTMVATPAWAESVSIVTSIKPVNALVASVMAGIGEPTLIVRGGESPHSYALRPSDAQALEDAAVVFWVGESLETFLADSIEGLAADAVSVELAEAEGVALLPVREGGTWESHAHGDEDHDADHGTDAHNGAHDGDAGAEHDDEHGAFNPHVWLDPQNAAAMVDTIVAVLAEADPANAEGYRANGAATHARLGSLTAEMSDMLAPVAGEPFIVFHDAYPYLERRFGLNAVGAITVSPEIQPGAGRLREIRDKIENLGAACVFAEPQFPPALVGALIDGTSVRSGVLDPLGADLEDGPDQYFALMRRNAAALRTCLEGVG